MCFEFNKRDMSAAELIADLSGQVKIRDLSLEEPDIEDIIKTIYHSGEIGTVPAAFRGWCSGRPRWGRRPWP